MSPEQKLYDFEGAFELAVQKILTAAGFTVNVPSNAAQFAVTRPRVDCLFEVGQEKKSYHLFQDGTRRNASWSATFTLEVITDSGDTAGSSQVHRAYRASVRSAIAPGLTVLNGADAQGNPLLPYHKLQLATETGTSVTYPWEDNTERSRITFSVDFGIDRAAWAELGLVPI